MSEKRKAEDILAELGRKIDELVSETKRAGVKVSEDMDRQIARLKNQKETLENQLNNKSTKSGEKFTEFKSHLNDAAEALNKAFAAIFKN